jgi:RHS repeat-associated protein
VERIIWDGDQVLMELRAANTTSHFTTGSAYYGAVLYTHAGGIDQPLDVIKGTQMLSPYTNWRGLYAGGTGSDGLDCNPSLGGWCSGLQFPGDKWTVYLNEREAVPPRPVWFGSLIRGSADASGLLYRRNRYYDPTTGQFTQEDPIGIAGGLNLYGYANGDPLGLSDPFGLCPDDEEEDPDDCSFREPVLESAGIFDPITLLAGGVAGGIARLGARPFSRRIENTVPSTLARVVPGNLNPATLGVQVQQTFL